MNAKRLIAQPSPNHEASTPQATEVEPGILTHAKVSNSPKQEWVPEPEAQTPTPLNRKRQTENPKLWNSNPQDLDSYIITIMITTLLLLRTTLI